MPMIDRADLECADLAALERLARWLGIELADRGRAELVALIAMRMRERRTP